jgi:outer membrane murein-binding lipoprotein Lpp
MLIFAIVVVVSAAAGGYVEHKFGSKASAALEARVTALENAAAAVKKAV